MNFSLLAAKPSGLTLFLVPESMTYKARCNEVLSALSDLGDIASLNFHVNTSGELESVAVSFWDIRVERHLLTENCLGSIFKCVSANFACTLSRGVLIIGGGLFSEIGGFMSDFGEMDKIYFEGSNVIVEFYDARAAQRALTSQSGQVSEINPPIILNRKRQTLPLGAVGENFYQVNADAIQSGNDTRTTCMIRNIPNKYSQKMILKMLDIHFLDTYDFFYLPVDFKVS